MKWSLDVNFKTRIRPAALSAILESHDSMVTAIQWIHPLNEVSELEYRLLLFKAMCGRKFKMYKILPN